MRDRIFAHISGTTRERARVIDLASARFLARLFPITCRQERARVLDLAILQTHVHLLVRMHPTTQLPRLLQRLKGASAVLAGRRGLPENGRTLRWAKGYDVESVSPRAVSAVSQYIRNQHRQHPAEVIPGMVTARTPRDLLFGDTVPRCALLSIGRSVLNAPPVQSRS